MRNKDLALVRWVLQTHPADALCPLRSAALDKHKVDGADPHGDQEPDYELAIGLTETELFLALTPDALQAAVEHVQGGEPDYRGRQCHPVVKPVVYEVRVRVDPHKEHEVHSCN